MIARGHHIHAPIEQRVADVLRDAEARGGVLGVGDREVDAVVLDQRAQAFANQLASGAPDDVPDEQDVHAGRRESVSTGIVCA